MNGTYLHQLLKPVLFCNKKQMGEIRLLFPAGTFLPAQAFCFDLEIILKKV